MVRKDVVGFPVESKGILSGKASKELNPGHIQWTMWGEQCFKFWMSGFTSWCKKLFPEAAVIKKQKLLYAKKAHPEVALDMTDNVLHKNENPWIQWLHILNCKTKSEPNAQNYQVPLLRFSETHVIPVLMAKGRILITYWSLV